MTARTRVLVVEDSTTVRARLLEVLASDPAIEVIGEAADGKQAIELCKLLRPDVVTMDMMLPEMSGLSATEYIMAYCPTPILIVSSSVNRGELFKTYEALSAGALDVLEKPSGEEPPGVWERTFLSTVKLIARIRVITHPRGRLAPGRPMPMRVAPPPATDVMAGCRAIAIGASTGGPGAIVDILRSLPSEFDLPILFVLHINVMFGAAFAEWLDGQSTHRVAYAKDGESFASTIGRVVMAPPDSHLVVRDGRLRITHDPERHSCRPSVDVLFESVAAEFGPSAAGILLTGMGRDGASGLLEMRRAGAFTVAQDQATSVVYGMPQQAALLNAAVRIVPLPEVGPLMTSLWRRQVAA
ncbi:MAG: chemotaxis-specific protein-glutamate methyltransferase CheB [Bauldia sp.]